MPTANLGRPGLSVLPLGVGDAFSVIHHPTSFLVSRYENPAWDEGLILVDCPQSIRKMMREADDGRYHGLDLHRVGTLILTHLHADHASGLETIAAFFKIALGRKLRLVALPEVLKGVPRFLETLSSLGKMEDFFDVVPVTEEDALELFPAEDGFNNGMVLRVRKTQHPVPTSALRFWYRGRNLAYSCDTSFDEGLWNWLWTAYEGLVIHEVGHGIHADLDTLLNVVSTREILLMEGLRSTWEHLRLVHYPDDLLPTLEAHPKIQLLREGKLEVIR